MTDEIPLTTNQLAYTRGLILRRIEQQTRQLLADLGNLSESYDAADVIAALGHLELAAHELRVAAIVCERQAAHS